MSAGLFALGVYSMNNNAIKLLYAAAKKKNSTSPH